MAVGQELLLSEIEQLDLTVMLSREGFFGVKEDPSQYIKLKSERMSPHYLDVRPGISDYGTRLYVAQTMLELAAIRVEERGFTSISDAYEYIAGTPEAMTSYAASTADLAQMGVLQPRVDANKQTGNKTPILGRYSSGARVAEFDDVVTDGESKINTIKLLGGGRTGGR